MRGGVTGVAATFGAVALVAGDGRGDGVAFIDGLIFGDGETSAILGKAIAGIEGDGETGIAGAGADAEGGDCRLINGRLIKGINPRTGTINQGRCFSQLTIACLLMAVNLTSSRWGSEPLAF
jgi:hypothetical protein